MLLQARERELQANLLNIERAQRQADIATARVEIADLKDRQKLFKAQGKYGARAAQLQGQAASITALGTAATGIQTTYDAFKQWQNKQH